jgi:hypothetical protein
MSLPEHLTADLANYPDYLERTNLSCGDSCEHTRREMLNLVHLTNLANRLMRADWSRLFATRSVRRSA